MQASLLAAQRPVAPFRQAQLSSRAFTAQASGWDGGCAARAARRLCGGMGCPLAALKPSPWRLTAGPFALLQVPLTVARPAARRVQLQATVVASAAAVEAAPEAVAHLRYSRGSPLKVRGRAAASGAGGGAERGGGQERAGGRAGGLQRRAGGRPRAAAAAAVERQLRRL